jgi:membrane peptidoglycan carboxypeptidase
MTVLTRLLAMLVISVVIGVLTAALALPFVGLVGKTSRAAAEATAMLPKELAPEPLAQQSRVLDRHGKVLARFYDEYRVTVPLKKVAPVMREAIVAIEDSRFYDHGAVDLQGTLRAFMANRRHGETVQGGSTLTQQLVKLMRLNRADTEEERRAVTAQTYERKFRELRYALALERHHSKDWILQRYLNLAYFGDGAYGVEAAARHYFSRHAADLTLRQAATLAGLVKNPSGYAPTTHPRRAQHRRNVVLNRMAELGKVSAKRADAAQRRGLGLHVKPVPRGCVASYAPWFCGYVREYLLHDKALGESRAERLHLLRTGGLTVRTTLDRRMQRAADRAGRQHVRPTDRAIGALAMVEPRTGEVRAIAQSRPMGGDTKKGETFINYVVPPRYGDSNGFQAGSTFKVFVLAAAIKQGIPLTTKIKAPPEVKIPVSRFRGCEGHLRSDAVWNPHNSTGSGVFNLYTGTRTSVNTFFAKLELRTGLCQPYRLAKQMGIRLTDPDNQQVPSFTLGVVATNPLAMAGAYATFAARGVHCEPRPVTSVRDRHGKVLERVRKDCDRVLKRAEADAVNQVLRGLQLPGGFGYQAGIALDQPSAAKTGTTDKHRAVWFMGYTPNLVTASMIAGANRQGHWVSLNGQVLAGQYVNAAHGSTTAGPMWYDAMKVVQRWLPDAHFHQPDPTLVEGVRPRGEQSVTADRAADQESEAAGRPDR